MEMRMVKQVLSPTVENREEADRRAQMLGVSGNGLESFGGGPEKNAVDGPLVLERNVGNLFRYGKDDMKILGVQKLRLAVFDPHSARARDWHLGQ